MCNSRRRSHSDPSILSSDRSPDLPWCLISAQLQSLKSGTQFHPPTLIALTDSLPRMRPSMLSQSTGTPLSTSSALPQLCWVLRRQLQPLPSGITLES